MEIVKAFQENNLNIPINVEGTFDNPLFRASDIATVLGISNIHVTIKDFDKTEKVISNAYTLGGAQDVTFLTEKGLYQVLFTSRKPIAKTFKNWVCEVIREIRLSGTYDLEQQLTLKEQQLHDQLQTSNKDRENILVLNFRGKHVFYLIKVEETLIKFGTNPGIFECMDHKNFDCLMNESSVIVVPRVRTVTKGNFQCSQCKNVYILNDSLMRHIRQKH